MPPDSVVTRQRYEQLQSINSNWNMLQGGFEDVVCPSCREDLKIRVGRHGPWLFVKPSVGTSLQHHKRNGELCCFSYGDVKVGV